MADETKPKKPRAKPAPKPPKSVDELVLNALKLAAGNPKAKWSGKKAPVLFNESEENHQAAIQSCLAPARPLLRQVNGGGVLTAAGLESVAESLDADASRAVFERAVEGAEPVEVAALTKLVAAQIPLSERRAFVMDAIGRTPAARAELNTHLAEINAAEEAESHAKVERAKREKEAFDAEQRAIEETKRLSAENFRIKRDVIRKQWEAFGGVADELPEPAARPQPSAQPATKSAGTDPEPRTSEEKDFRRNTADRLISVWLHNARHQKVEIATALERVLRSINGVVAIGRVGEQVAFDGRIHECERGVSDGAQVRVVLPGWTFEGVPGEPLRRALVE